MRSPYSIDCHCYAWGGQVADAQPVSGRTGLPISMLAGLTIVQVAHCICNLQGCRQNHGQIKLSLTARRAEPPPLAGILYDQHNQHCAHGRYTHGAMTIAVHVLPC